MKGMVYRADRKTEVLYCGEYKGHKFAILSLGTHPTAYVENKLPNCTSYDDERLDDVSVHCGFTYCDKAYWDDEEKALFLGWDYAHFRDFSGYFFKYPAMMDDTSKKWTTIEIFDEVKSVINQLCMLEGESNG